jgi:hypothetical protein
MATCNVSIFDQGAALPTADIIFTNMQVSSMDSITGLTQAQLLAQFRSYGIIAKGASTSCISVTGSHMENMVFGAGVFANNMLLANNEIDHDGDDMVDYGASNILLSHNYLHDDLNIGNGAHMDGMQGYPLTGGATTWANVTIDSNLIIRQTDPNLPFPTYLQGIDAFDGDWTNMTITNNVIVTSSCFGVQTSSIHNGLIANNTALDDGLIATPGCTPTIGGGGPSHEGPPSTNTRFTNNIANNFVVGGVADVGVTYDHNVALAGWFQHVVNGAWVFNGPRGTDANGNVSFATTAYPSYASQFVTWSPSTLQFNLMLKAGSVAIGAGVAGAPTVDILGVTRTAPYTAGAYSYPY